MKSIFMSLYEDIMGGNNSKNNTNPNNKENKKTISDFDVDIMKRASDKVESGKSQDPNDIMLHKKNQELKKKKENLSRKLSSVNIDNIQESRRRKLGRRPRHRMMPPDDIDGGKKTKRGGGIPHGMDEEGPEPPGPSGVPGSQADVLSPEGEVFYVDLIKKALHVEFDKEDLTDEEKDALISEVDPKNAKALANIYRKIISHYGLEV